MDSGWGEIRFCHSRRENEPSLFPSWILGAHYNALRMVKAYREGVGAPEAEYALDWELFDGTGQALIGSWRPGRDPIGEVELPLQFPRLSVGDPAESNELLHRVYEDLLHAAGTTMHQGDEPLVYDFD
jgi:hypothetical protein